MQGSHRKRGAVDPGRQQREQQLALVEARSELDLARRAAERGNDALAGMILRSVRAKLDLVDGRRTTRKLSNRPSRDALNTEIAALGRRSELARFKE